MKGNVFQLVNKKTAKILAIRMNFLIQKIKFRIILAQNPEFDKAFPFLRNYKKPSTLFRKDEEYDYLDSLRFFQQNIVNKKTTKF